MSAINGDKSRFNRLRKQKIARRKRTQELVERATKSGRREGTSAGLQARSVPA